MVADARKMIKDFLDARLSATNMKEDDAVTNASFIVCFDYPTYPLIRVFNDKEVDLIFSVGKLTNTALTDYTQAPYGYREMVPIDVCCIDKTGITGVKLLQKAEAELRRVIENYTVGTAEWEDLSEGSDITKFHGRTKIYGVRVILKYVRGIT